MFALLLFGLGLHQLFARDQPFLKKDFPEAIATDWCGRRGLVMSMWMAGGSGGSHGTLSPGRESKGSPHLDPVAHAGQCSRPESRDPGQFLHRRKPAVLLAIPHNRTSPRRADAGQRIELSDTGRVQVEPDA